MGMKPKTTLPAIPEVPGLPVTTVNPQPRNEASPVAPAKKTIQAVESKRPNENGKSGTDTMSKGDWAEKNRKEDIRAILNTTVASPAVAQMVIGKSTKDTLATIREVFKFNLALYDEKIGA